MQLANYINDLLYRYDCVIIPGFGALLTQYKSAVVQPETHTFFPPTKTVSFNRRLQTNDGLLANYVATVEQCSYETALQRIRNFTGTISLKLSEGENVEIKGIGSFQLNTEKSVQFQPAEKQNFSTASFGMTQFISPKVSREVYKEAVEKLEEKAPIRFTPEKREAQPYLKYAAIALIALTLGGFGGMKLYENNIKEHNLAERQKANTLLENQIQEATFVIDNPLPAIHLNIKKETGIYHIIAGAYSEPENAEKKVLQLKAKGFSPSIITANRYGLTQVIYNSFSSRKEALQSLYQIKGTENSDAWLLVKDLSD